MHETTRGDLVKFEDDFWLITNQVSKRYESYKAKMQRIEHNLIFNLSKLEDKPLKYLLKLPVLVSQTADFNLSYNKQAQIINVESEIHVFTSHNDKTESLLQLLDERIVFGHRTFKIAGISTANKGILDITAQLVPAQVNDNLNAGIADCPQNWQELIDDSTYRVSDENVALLPPAGKSSIEFVSFKDGILTFTAEKLKAEFADSLVGYKITTFSKEYVWGYDEPFLKENEAFMTASERVKIDNLPVEVSSVFDNGIERIELEAIRFE